MRPKIEVVHRWTEEIHQHFPDLSRPQVAVLAEASFALMTVGQWGLDLMSEFLSALYNQPVSTVRSRFHEWYCEAQAKNGEHRQTLDVQACFAPLLQWVCELAASGRHELALALDASTVRDRLTVLCVSVLVGGGAIPVAWKMLVGNTPGAWKPHWQVLLRTVSAAIPGDWFVVVTADRGLYAVWLFGAIQANGWHPLLRINSSGFFQAESESGWQPLSSVVEQPGESWTGRCPCFKTSPLVCTLVATWAEKYADPWPFVSDLAPHEAEAWWYGLRSSIERGFRDTKRGLFQWHRARVTDPARAERMWLIIAVATLRFTAIGTQPTPSATQNMTVFPPSRSISLLRRGMVMFLAALVLSLSCPDGGWHDPMNPETALLRKQVVEMSSSGHDDSPPLLPP